MSLPSKILNLILNKEASKEPLMIGYANETHVVALFRLLGLLVASNKVVTRAEAEVIEKFILLQVPETVQTLAKESFEEGGELYPTKSGITKYAFTLYWEPANRWLEPLQVLDIMLRVAFADGEFTDWEEYIIDATRLSLGVHSRAFLILRDTLAARHNLTIKGQKTSFMNAKDWSRIDKEARRARSSRTAPPPKKVLGKREDALVVFGLLPNATAKEIRDAHRSMVKKYHPDLQKAGEMTEAEVSQAIVRFLAVQEAYEVLMG